MSRKVVGDGQDSGHAKKSAGGVERRPSEPLYGTNATAKEKSRGWREVRGTTAARRRGTRRREKEDEGGGQQEEATKIERLKVG